MPPTVLALTPEKTTYRDGRFTATQAIVVTDSFADLVAILKEDYDKFLLQFKNAGANGFDVEVYGSAEANAAGVPPDFDLEDYTLLPNGAITVATDASDAVSNSDIWTWILIRVKRSGAGDDTTGSMFVRAK